MDGSKLLGGFDANRVVLALRNIRDATRHPQLLLLLMFIIYGFGHTDFQDFSQLTRDPFILLPRPDRQFLHSSPLIFFIGWPLTHLIGPNASYLLVTLAGLVFLGSSLTLLTSSMTERRKTDFLLIFLSSPLTLALLSWFGKSDTYLLAFFILYVRSNDNKVLNFAMSVLMVLSHKEIGTVILLGDCILRRRFPPASLAGVLMGHAVVHAYHASLSAPPFSRIDLGFAFIGPALKGWIANPLTHIALGFGWFWIFLGMRWREPDLPRVATVVGLCFVAAFTTADFTRDFILCAAPLLLYTAEKIVESPDRAVLATRWPVPLLCLVQAQIESFSVVHDSMWPGIILPAHWFN